MTEQTLRALAAAGAPSVTIPPFLAEHVVALHHRSVRRRRVGASLALAGLVAGGAVAARSGEARFYEVYSPSGSMAPTLGIGEHLVADRTLTPQREDVVQGSFVNGPERFLTVRRLIGLPGDVIACPAGADGSCRAWTRNGQALSEPWVGRDRSYDPTSGGNQPTPSPGSFLDVGNRIAPFAAVTVTPGHVFLLGDNRDDAVDSRISDPELQEISGIRGVGVQVIGTDGRRRAIPGAPLHDVPGPGGTVDPAAPPEPARAVPAGPGG